MLGFWPSIANCDWKILWKPFYIMTIKHPQSKFSLSEDKVLFRLKRRNERITLLVHVVKTRRIAFL